MGLFDRKAEKETPKADFTKLGGEKPRADFSNVRNGSSSTAPAPAKFDGRTYVVERGDTLWAIAERFYGNGNLWPKIHEANRGLIEDPDIIQPGWTLVIPPHVEEEGR